MINFQLQPILLVINAIIVTHDDIRIEKRWNTSTGHSRGGNGRMDNLNNKLNWNTAASEEYSDILMTLLLMIHILLT
jgi:hypothetical protein